ncbi:DUF2157 domain-containing protein [Flavobacterium tibetense]|uniref:DUF2157 domain-containing protein n=1 Tax=Flavobacterium tibetense TaxID=2233533 RepID=A0A365P330_9FLAO|nr:DUF2157 domain-containing protein [Flavobacterium tibetense]RBA28948.1 DUF2157 domain-containing protein [Flavobacterium tibetense]
MEKSHFSEILLQKLHQKEFLNENDLEEIVIYQKKGIFSLRSELLLMIYFSVILFTSGIGVIVYNNIDSIGHLAILSANFILMLVCFYFSFKKAKGYANDEVVFENPLYDYLVLTGSLLACIFLGYINFQYQIFDESYAYVSLISALLCFFVAYYFDNRIVLSLAITSLAAFIGISISPKSIFQNEIYSSLQLTYSGLVLGIGLLVWMEHSLKTKIKAHFHFVYATFALHLLGVCIMAGLLSEHWFVFIPILIGFVYFFYKFSYRVLATSLFAFMLLYGYFGVNILIGKFLFYIDFGFFHQLVIMVSPFYVIASIYFFIRLVKQFNAEKNASVQ